MKTALIGYGAMGKLIRTLAEEKGHMVGVVIDEADADASPSELAERLGGSDVAIDFSIADAVRRNVEAAMIAGVPLVQGTTGWNTQRDEIEAIVREADGAFVFGANFSIGVNLFYRITKQASALFAAVSGYSPFIEEAHHNRKRDAPSGTALKLRYLMSEHLGPEIPTSSTRAGHIPGTHRVGFDSEADQILLTHTARSRQGFASGALLAAHWIHGRTGVFEFGEVIEEIIATKEHKNI
jgi:4-hydroxy-tetrahydrodipicolinate reductase